MFKNPRGKNPIRAPTLCSLNNLLSTLPKTLSRSPLLNKSFSCGYIVDVLQKAIYIELTGFGNN